MPAILRVGVCICLLALLAVPPVIADDYPSLYPERRLEFEPGMTLAYVDHGEGLPVVFLHGLGADHHQWNDHLPAVAEGHRVLALDFPGHGKSDRVEGYGYGIPRCSAALVALLDARGIEKAVLVGNSMGGHVALYTALHHPERVLALVLVDAAGGKRIPCWKRNLAGIARELDLARLVTPAASRVLDGFVVMRRQESDVTREIREKVVRDLALPESRRHFLEVLDTSLASIDENDLSGDLRRIRQPALIVWGASDLLLPLDHALRLRCGLPRSRLVVYPGVGHVPSVEVPGRFNRTLLRFLDRCE